MGTVVRVPMSLPESWVDSPAKRPTNGIQGARPLAEVQEGGPEVQSGERSAHDEVTLSRGLDPGRAFRVSEIRGSSELEAHHAFSAGNVAVRINVGAGEGSEPGLQLHGGVRHLARHRTLGREDVRANEGHAQEKAEGEAFHEVICCRRFR